MKITALKYGESEFGENYIFKGGREDRLLPISFVIYLIQTDNRKILVDAGCDDKAGFAMTCFQKPVEVLEEYGVKPEEITDVILTHAHHDHIEAVGHYQQATIHIEKEEYSAAKKYLRLCTKIHLIEEEFSLTDRVTIKRIGGHTMGSCIVLADNYVLCGDECYNKKCLTDSIITGVSCNEERSAQFIKKYQAKEYIPLLFHDPSILPGRIGWEEYSL